MKRTLSAIVVAAITLLLIAATVGRCSADFVIAFHGPGCRPCTEMTPVENALQQQGYDIRACDVTEWPQLARFYRIRTIPQYVYVTEIGGKQYDSGLRIVGKCSQQQLQTLCEYPIPAAIGDGIRRTFRVVSVMLGGAE
jgi:hypothetical protein